MMRLQTTNFLEKYFKKVIVVEDGQEDFEKFIAHKDEIDIVVSDIVMPNMTGIQMVREIRKTHQHTPCIMATSIIDPEVFVEAIDLNVAGYAIKPVDYDQLLKTLVEVSESVHNKKLLKLKENEAKQYLDAINGVAIVTKTDLNGIITYANRMFTEISQYSLEELIGSPHNIVRHPDVPAKAYEDMWALIKNGKEWKGTIKNKAKDGSSYFVKSYVFPLFDESHNIKEYMAIRILMTDEENAKRDFKKGVLKNITKNKLTESQLKKENIILQERIEELKKLAIAGDKDKVFSLEQQLLKCQKANRRLEESVKYSVSVTICNTYYSSKYSSSLPSKKIAN